MHRQLRVRWRFIKGLAAIGVVVAAGYPSNLISEGACCRSAVRRVLAETGPLENAYVFPGSSSKAAGALRSAGVEPLECSDKPDQANAPFRCFPWIEVSSPTTLAPYVVVVREGHVLFTTSGGGGESLYVTFFGVAVRLKYRGGWAA